MQDTWLHVLLKYKQQHIHALIIINHNKALWKVRKLIVSTRISRHYILMKAGTHNEVAGSCFYGMYIGNRHDHQSHVKLGMTRFTLFKQLVTVTSLAVHNLYCHFKNSSRTTVIQKVITCVWYSSTKYTRSLCTECCQNTIAKNTCTCI